LVRGWNSLVSGDSNFIMMGGHDGSRSVAQTQYWDISTSSVNASNHGSDINAQTHGPGSGAGYSGLT